MPPHSPHLPQASLRSTKEPCSPPTSAVLPPGRERIDWADVAKGLCIVLVVLLHSTHGVENALNTVSWLHPFVEFARPFRMPDFFLLSGLFMARALLRDRGAYLDAKVTHFVYFYVLWTLIQVGLKETSILATDGANAFVLHVLNRLFVAPIGVMWFLYILTAFFLTAWVFRRRPALLLVLSIPLHLFDDEIVATLDPWIGSAGGLLWEYCSRMVFFVTGWLGASAFFRLAAWANGSAKTAVALLVIWAAINGALVWQGSHLTNWIGLSLGLVGAAAVVVFSSLVAPTFFGTMLRAAGRRSLIVFSSFFLWIAATRTVLLKLFPGGDAGTIALGVFAAALLTPFVLSWLIERTGQGRFLIERPRWARRRKDVSSSPALQPAV
ncbi:MAG: acyltransferase [Opitutus sp.]|nr:acyltransferase [Opitutus sp.]